MKIKKIPGLERCYATDCGKIIGKRGHFLKPVTSKDGYPRISTYINKKKSSAKIHRLVFEAFNGSITYGMQINHIDGNKKNSSIYNLEMVTPSENVYHAWKIGLKKREAVSKLSLDQVKEIELTPLSVSGTELAKSYGITRQHANGIRRKYKKSLKA